MNAIYSFLDVSRRSSRVVMHNVAKGLNSASNGKLSPNTVTIIGLLMHVPIAVLIVWGYYLWAALLLVIFGLFDTLDGELARLQNRASVKGMLLDASTDRMKEVILYTGIAAALVYDQPAFAIWAVTACGSSLLVSYVKAKGEMAVKSTNLSPNELNRLFQDGLMRFEVRMAVLVLGLLLNQLGPAVVVIAVTASLTAFGRLRTISARL